jgi:hypothetical protein
MLLGVLLNSCGGSFRYGESTDNPFTPNTGEILEALAAHLKISFSDRGACSSPGR